jgi:hypothetical protein
MSERSTPPTTSISDAERAADDGFPHLPLLEEWLPERAADDGSPHLPLLEEWLPKPLAPTDPERAEEPLREERQDEQASVKSR